MPARRKLPIRRKTATRKNTTDQSSKPSPIISTVGPDERLMSGSTPNTLSRAARLIAGADALIVGAGAGMSADSGIPVYRGTHGIYTNPEALNEATAAYYETNLPAALETARQRHHTLLTATPHPGYAILNQWQHDKPYGAFVYTSNVDSLFIRAGFPDTTVYDTHGSQARSQCLAACLGPASPVFDTPDPAHGPAFCPRCLGPARPNTLMFGDFAFNDTHRAAQWENFGAWFDTLPEDVNVVVLELGAGTEVRTVRAKCEAFAAAYDWPLIRINPAEADLPATLAGSGVSLPMTALDALTALNALIEGTESDAARAEG